MFKLLVVSAIVACAAADVAHLFKKQPQFHAQYQPQQSRSASSGNVAEILRHESVVNPDGSYAYGYETSNGISAQAQGQLRQVGAELGNVVQGSFQYVSQEGVPVAVQYVADENGYQPASDLLPTPPPVPALILRSLAYNAAHPEPQAQQEFRTLPVSPFGRRF